MRQLLLLPLSLSLAAATPSPDPAHALWFDAPARHFTASFPLGDGRLGAMVFGGVDEERIVLNESSVWSGSIDPAADRPDAHRALPEIRRLLLEGKNAEAEKLVNQHFTSAGLGSAHAKAANAPFGCYQTLGTLRLFFPSSAAGSPPATDYHRQLDLPTALATVTYVRDGVRFTREHFVSAPDQAIVTRLTADRPGALTLDVALDRSERFTTTLAAPAELLMQGTLNDGRGGPGLTYAARLRVLAPGGTVAPLGSDRLRITAADEVLIFVAAATDYRGFAGRQLTDPVAATLADLDHAAAKPYAALRSAQRADHARYYDRATLDLPATPNSALPTDRRLSAFASGAPDPALAALYFHFGRYLLISSSRPGGFPANLQGLWAEEIQTPWNGDWHLDINVQMNYWPAELTGLPELHQPLHALIASLVEPGRRTARAYYDSPGWIAHVFTTPWGFTSPGESADWGATISGSAWLAQHLWEPHAFAPDLEHLRRVYPLLRESCEFYLANLLPEPRHGWLVTGPSNSPENRFRLPDGRVAHVCLGPAVDQQLLRELFANTAAAAAALGIDADFREKLLATRALLAPDQIAPDGRLQEWLEPYPEPEPTHRHTSPLYALHPGYTITRRGTPELAAACRRLLDARGDDSTGWALAWRANLWARLGDGDRAHKLLAMLLRPAGRGSGTYPNLFSACPPFQIDANFGGCAGVAEMLLQSHAGEIELLPALPAAWPSGTLRGLRARGGFTVDLAWTEGRLTTATLRGPAGASTPVRLGDHTISVTLPPSGRLTLGPDLTSSIP